MLTPEEVKGLTLDEALIIYKKKLSLHLEDNCKDDKDYQVRVWYLNNVATRNQHLHTHTHTHHTVVQALP